MTRKKARRPVEPPKDNPWWKVFIPDQATASTTICDVGLGEYTLVRSGGGLAWKPAAPWQFRGSAPFCLTSLTEIPAALIELATAQRLAFKVRSKELSDWSRKYACVMVPRGDRRLEVVATQPENCHEVPGLAHGYGFLFDASDHEGNGRLTQEVGEEGLEESYGLSVWGRFYAIEIEESPYEREPLIKVH
jgi:hypothetical protein